jgi:hypothetical protein
MRGRRLASVFALALLVTLLSPPAAKAAVPTGFRDEQVWGGLQNPTNL